MNTATILRGDAVTMLRTLPAQSVHCCVTSPPYWGLRSYLPDGHADKVMELGAEPTPAEYVANMVAVFAEVWRVLRDDGTLWLNVGDSYNGSGGAGGDYNANGLKAGQPKYPGRNVSGLKPKDLVGIPWRLAFALQDAGWYLRSDVIWAKGVSGQDAMRQRIIAACIGNGISSEKAAAIADAVDLYNGTTMPESVTDRPTKAHEYVFLLTKRARYFYDAAAVAEAATDEEYRTVGKIRPSLDSYFVDDPEKGRTRGGLSNQAGGRSTRNRRSVWTINPEPTPYAHFATMPTALAEVCILAGTSARGVCPECGAPWVRVVEKTPYTPPSAGQGERNVDASRGDKNRKLNGKSAEFRESQASVTTIGWVPSCTCAPRSDEWIELLTGDLTPEDEAENERRTKLRVELLRVYAGYDTIPATVLDPFAGSGTTLRVAVSLGRDGIGVELNPEYADLAERLLAQTQPALIAV